MTECQVQGAISSLLELDGWAVVSQWRLGSKKVDLVGFRDGEVHSYEIKLREWRRGGAQACLNSAYFHRSYVVLPSNPRRRVDEAWFRAARIGLILLSAEGELVHVVDPPRRELSDQLMQALGISAMD